MAIVSDDYSNDPDELPPVSEPIVVDVPRIATPPKLDRTVKVRQPKKPKLKLAELDDNVDDCLNKFLEILCRTGRPSDGIVAINADERTIYAFRAQDQEFREAWAMAERMHEAGLEDEVHRRAVEGVPKAILYKGEIVAIERHYSDNLLIALLRRRSRAWQDALSSAVTTNVDVNVAQALHNGPGGLEAPALDRGAMLRRMAGLSPAERAVARKMFGLDDTPILDVPGTDPTTDVPTPDHDSDTVLVHVSSHANNEGDDPSQT